MKISSINFLNYQKIPGKYTCDLSNINPELRFTDIPEETKSFALIMDDPDAPTGTFIHWVLFNISPTVNIITENSVPLGAVQGINSANSNKYIGPCPPSGTHRYFFKLYALDKLLVLSSDSGKKAVEQAMDGHILEKAELVGLYERSSL
jgi:Raf kinase inhibitor-like YbhB/YbcL family protein